MYLLLLLISCVHSFHFYPTFNVFRIKENKPLYFTSCTLPFLMKEYNITGDYEDILPILYKKYMEDKKIYYVDIDNTICSTEKSDYISSYPDYNIISKLNELFEKGNEIHYFTARGMVSKKDWSVFTIRQLHFWGVKYNTLNMGKPHYDYWIDDKSQVTL